MNNRTTKWLLVAGCLAICAVLVVLIGNSFSKEIVLDSPIVQAGDAGNSVVSPNASTDSVIVKDNTPAVVVNPNRNVLAPTDNGAKSSGTEQTIQPDVTMPAQPDADTLHDQTKTPDGKPEETPPTPVDHDVVITPPANPPQTAPSQPQSSGGLPGFNNVPNAGSNQGGQADDMYENGNKIGIMD